MYKRQTINFYSVDDCYFVDLPGYGYAKVSNADRERWDDPVSYTHLDVYKRQIRSRPFLSAIPTRCVCTPTV